MLKRKKIQQVWSIGMTVCFSICMQYCFSQNIQTSVDRQNILIGEQFKYTVKAIFPSSGINTQWFNIPDSVAHFEVIDRSKIDTVSTDNEITLSQTITYTSFDSGKWNTPALQVNFTKPDHSTANLLSDSVAINVGYSPADSTNTLRDIKPITDVTTEDYFWYYIAGGIVLLLIIIYLLWRYFKNKKKKLVPEFDAKLSAYDEALLALEKLKQLNLEKPEDIKQYHDQLSQIFKRFISRKRQIAMKNKTTSDVLIVLSENNLPKEIIANAAATLRVGDAAKFAKYLPTMIESKECLNNIKSAIETMSVPKPTNTSGAV